MGGARSLGLRVVSVPRGDPPAGNSMPTASATRGPKSSAPTGAHIGGA